MNARRHAHRAVLVATGALMLTAVGSGCSAPPGEPTGKSGQDLVYEPGPHPILPLDVITTKTGPVAPDGAICGSDTIAVPPALQPYGCTLGVELTYPPPPDTFALPPKAGYAFACQVPVPEMSTLGLPVPVPEWIAWSEFVSQTSTPTSCFGVPASGYTVVLDMFDELHIGHGGCVGTGCGQSGY
jgi:hypothetical protein